MKYKILKSVRATGKHLESGKEIDENSISKADLKILIAQKAIAPVKKSEKNDKEK